MKLELAITIAVAAFVLWVLFIFAMGWLYSAPPSAPRCRSPFRRPLFLSPAGAHHDGAPRQFRKLTKAEKQAKHRKFMDDAAAATFPRS